MNGSSFDSKTGFCNYYATAEVLLLRSIGIPARLAVGFSQGEVTNSGRSYTIKRKNSHAWPEVYFPGTGWVVFEPTSSLPIQFFIPENKTGSIIQEETILSVKPVPESNVLESATNTGRELQENENAIRVGINTNRKNIYITLGFLLGVTVVFGSTAYYLSRHEKSRSKILLWISYRYKKAGINPPVWFDEILTKNQRSKIESIFRDTIKIGEFARVLYKSRGTPSEKIQELTDAYPVVKDEGEIILKEYQRYMFGGISADENLAKNAFLKLRAEVLKTHFRKHFGLLYRRKRGTLMQENNSTASNIYMDQKLEYMKALINGMQAKLEDNQQRYPTLITEGITQLGTEVDTLRKLSKRQEEERRSLRALAQIGQVVNSTLELDIVLQIVMDTIVRLTHAERGFLMLKDHTGMLTTRVARNWEQESLPDTESTFSSTIVNSVISTGKPLLTTNAQQDPRFDGQESVIAYNLRSIMCVPMKIKDEITGVIYTDNRIKTGMFGTKDLDLLVGFANQAAFALENARLFNSVRRTLDEVSRLKKLDGPCIHLSGIGSSDN